ncbi:MAG: TlpA family protein disulfide reductase [Burkholderiaceae bacterium]
MEKRQLIKAGVTAAVAVAAVGAGVGVGLRKFSVTPADDAIVEDFLGREYPDPAGRQTTLSTYRGQVLVVNFWATWCAPCIQEMPELSEIQDETLASGVKVLGLAIDSAPKVRAFSQRLPVSYPLLVLGASGIDLAKQFGNTSGSLPYTVVINRSGAIVNQTLGRFNKQTLLQTIEKTVARS